MAESTRNKILNKYFLLADGTKVNNATPEAQAIVFAFSDGEDLTYKLSDFAESIIKCAVFHGLSQKIGDAAAGSAKEAATTGEAQIDIAKNNVQAVAEALMEGTWIKRAVSAGPRATVFAEALFRAMVEAGKDAFKDGTKVTETSCAAYAKELGTEKRKAMLDPKDGNPAIRAAYEAIKAERAAAKAAATAAEAESATTAVEDL